MQLSPLPWCLAPLEVKYPQHPILEHPQPMFLPQRARLRSTIMEYNRKNYSSVHFNLSFSMSNWKAGDLRRKIVKYFLR